KGLRLGAAPRGERGGVEIEHDRPLFQLRLEVQCERLAGQRTLGGKVRRRSTGRELRHGGSTRGDGASEGEKGEDRLAHLDSPVFAGGYERLVPVNAMALDVAFRSACQAAQPGDRVG